MKKFGKFEKRPEEVPQKPPKVKNVLLQTYFTSLLSLVLCVTMFLGTTMAWFTDEVVNTGNEIYVGTLSVELALKKTAAMKAAEAMAAEEGEDAGLSEEYVSLTDTNARNVSYQVFDDTIHWEPGYTALRVLKVEKLKEENLDFNYILGFIPAENSAVNTAVAECFRVYAKEGDQTTNDTIPASFQNIEKNWTPVMNGDKIATLADILTMGLPVFSGTIDSEEDEEAEQIFTIALHMNEDADSAIMGEKLSLSVKLTAYQKSSETDDLGKNYDALTTVSNADELTSALSDGGNIMMISDITLTESPDVSEGKLAALDLGGRTLTLAPKVEIDVYGTLKINGSGTVVKSSSAYQEKMIAVYDGGALQLDSGMLKLENGNDAQAVCMNGGSFTMNGGEIEVYTGSSGGVNNEPSSAIYVDTKSSVAVTLNNGTIDVNSNTYSCYCKAGTAKVNYSDSFCFETGDNTASKEPWFEKAEEGANLLINQEDD